MPRLVERVVDTARPIEALRWEIDPDFDLTNHVVEVAVPAPGDRRALLDLTTEIHMTPFPAGRPPWRLVLVTGLADGTGALIARLHHSVADGIGGLRMAEIFLTLEADTTPPPDTDLDAILCEWRAAATDHDLLIPLPPSGQRSPVPSVWPNRRRPNSHSSVRIRTSPTHGRPALDTVRTVIDQLTGDPSSTAHRNSGRAALVGATSSPLRCRSRQPAPRQGAGGTINDLYVTALADAAIAYHAERGTEPRSVAMSFVRSTRTGSGAGGNAFVPIKVRPRGRRHSDERFAALSNAMAPSDASDGEPGLGAVSALAALIPTPVLTRLGRDQGARIDVVTSNIRGAPVPIFVGDAHVLGTFPIGPVAGAACNATVMSREDSLDIGIMIDPAAIDDPDRFGDIVQATLDAYTATRADDASALRNCAGLADVDRMGDGPVTVRPCTPGREDIAVEPGSTGGHEQDVVGRLERRPTVARRGPFADRRCRR